MNGRAKAWAAGIGVEVGEARRAEGWAWHRRAGAAAAGGGAVTKRKKREAPAAVPRARIEDATVEKIDELGALVRIDRIDGSYEYRRFPMTATVKPAQTTTLCASPDAVLLSVYDDGDRSDRVAVRCRCGATSYGYTDATGPISCDRCGALLLLREAGA